MESEKQFTINQNILKSMISQTIFAVSLNDNKPVLTGELFDISDGELYVVAIDGFRLAVRKEKIDYDESLKFVVPSKALNEISKLLKDDDELLCTVCTNNKHIMFDINGYHLFSRLLEGEFHNYKASISNEFKTEVIVKSREFIECLERCSLLINEKNKSPVKCNFNDGEVAIDCKTSIGKISDELSVDISGDSVLIGFNYKYILDVLKASECDKVKIHMNGGNKPISIVPLQGDSFMFLIMPVVLK
jgi:DNA polymerase-3 subunit beta